VDHVWRAHDPALREGWRRRDPVADSRVLYEAVAPWRRQRLHQRIAESLEMSYGDRVGEIAGELAAGFAEARQPEAAARFLELAASSAVRRFAYREAAEALQSAIGQLRQLPDSTERAGHEGRLQLELGNALMAAMSAGDPRVVEALSRAEEVARRADAPAASLQSASFINMRRVPARRRRSSGSSRSAIASANTGTIRDFSRC